jgi:hypothetical protein
MGLVHPAGALDGVHRDLFHGAGIDYLGSGLLPGILETDRSFLVRPPQGERGDAARQEERGSGELSDSLSFQDEEDTRRFSCHSVIQPLLQRFVGEVQEVIVGAAAQRELSGDIDARCAKAHDENRTLCDILRPQIG